MISGSDIVIGLEVLGFFVTGLLGFIGFLWRAFSNISKLHHRIALIEREVKNNFESFDKIYDKLDQMSKDIHAMRIEMLEAHSGIGHRLAKLEK